MEVKYQFQEKNGNKCFFDKKHDFLEFCQKKWSESRISKKTADSKYSFDYGKNWYSIGNFNTNRQTIQNEKKLTKIDLNGKFYFLRNNEQVGPFSLDEILKRKITNKTYVWTNGMVNWEMIENIPAISEKYNLSYRNKTNQNKDKLDSKNLNSNNEGNSNNWFTYIGILAIIVGVFYFYDSTKSESIDDIDTEYPADSDGNEEPGIYEDPIYDPDIQGNGIQDEPINNSTPSKEWVNCRNCHGRGEIVCDECNGTTLMFCGSCNGRGTFTTSNGTDICYLCKGALKVRCSQCHGKGTEGRCYVCGGSGQIQE